MSTRGLSRKELVLSKLEDGQWLTEEEREWAEELLSSADRAYYAEQIASQPPDAPIPLKPERR